MVTPGSSYPLVDGEHKLLAADTYYGKSTDTKPRNVGNGSWYIKIDKVGSNENFLCCYDAEDDKWYPDEAGD